MPVDTKLRKAIFDDQLEKKINEISNTDLELAGYKLISAFLSPIVFEGHYHVILVFQKGT